MSQDPQQISSVFRIDVSADPPPASSAANGQGGMVIELLRQMVSSQERQNKLLEGLVQQMGAQQRQRAHELSQWKQSNPTLARECRIAAERLGEVQTRFLETVTEEIQESAEHMLDGEFMLNEFVDRFGPRLAHLNGVLQTLAQLSSASEPTELPS